MIRCFRALPLKTAAAALFVVLLGFVVSDADQRHRHDQEMREPPWAHDLMVAEVTLPPSPAAQQKPALIVEGVNLRLASGSWRAIGTLKLSVLEGKVESMEIDTSEPIIVLAGPPIDKPDPPAKLRKVVTDATDKVPAYEHRTRDIAALKIVYETMKLGLDEGRLTPDKAIERIEQFRDQLWSQQVNAWSHWPATVDPLAHRTRTREALSSAYAEVIAALAPHSGAMQDKALGDLLRRLLDLFGGEGDVNWARVIEFVFQIIKLFGGV